MVPEGYRYHTPITVRFADLDAMGHLNHATYLTYMEHARICYVRDVCDWRGYDDDWATLGLILAHASIDYKLPVAYDDAVTVYTRTSRMGGKSFDLEYVLLREAPSQSPAVAATAKTVMVTYDYSTRTSRPIPDDWREKIQAFEESLSSGASSA